MSKRLLLKILLVLFSSGAIGEVAVVLFAGWHVELLLFVFFMSCFAVAIVFVVQQLLDSGERCDAIDSVSARRARAMQSNELRERLGAYGVDHEFLPETLRSTNVVNDTENDVKGTVDKKERVSEEAKSSLKEFAMERESFDAYIQRCMSGESNDGDFSDELSIGLENPNSAKGVGMAPTDFSHSPAAVMESLKKRAGRGE